jgi:hypothetical protein
MCIFGGITINTYRIKYVVWYMTVILVLGRWKQKESSRPIWAALVIHSLVTIVISQSQKPKK